ncbi:MAG: tyrosine-type recombinase/integrase [Faecousia sp.]
MSKEEADALLASLTLEKSEGEKNCKLFCLIALKSGLRRGELCGLMWSDIDFENALRPPHGPAPE